MKDTFICVWSNGDVSIETRPCAHHEGPFTNREARAILDARGLVEVGETCYFAPKQPPATSQQEITAP